MKEIKVQSPAYLEEWDIKVAHYLTYAQIQQIINAVKEFDTWSERKQNIDMLVLYHATDITAEELEKTGHEVLLLSGLIEAVYQIVKNTDYIYTGLKYTESIERSLTQIAKELPNYIKPLEKVVNKYGDKVQK